MKLIIKTLLTVTSLICAFVSAQPVQKEISGAYIIAVRPVDMWSPDTKFNQLILDIINDKRSSFSYFETNGKNTGVSKSFFSDPVRAPVAEIIYEKFKNSGFKVGNDGAMFSVQLPTPIATSDLPELIAAQNAVYAKSIEKSGNPDKLEGKESAKKFFGNLLSLATFIGVGEKYGFANANSAVIGNGVAFDLGASVQKFGKILVPRPLPQVDLSNYKQADIYRVTSLKTVGMVIIAYKEPKTLETERAALAEAIFSLTGADTTPEAIVKEREQDFAMRKKIWAACVERGECHD